ncbi:MAG TPA: thioredoxin-disulfide reductase, partial [Chloroflexota bacterium]|nr:thioredoxin-disulfide reductase [Chloroflexota bacterium]
TAAIYAARADLHPLVIAGRQSGGQLMLTSEVENFPGFPEGIMGPELMDRMRQQAERFGAEFIDEDANAVDFTGKPLAVFAEDIRHEARAVIIATGASARWLGLPSEARLMGRGVSSCATCDGFFFRGKDVAVVGGGDTALEEAIFLTKFARSVTLIHRRKELRGSKIMQDRAQNNPKISFIWDSVVCEVLGSDHVEGVKIENVLTKQTSELAVDGLFVAIGYTPNTKILEGQIELDERGYVRVHHETRTNVEGVFVAGDVEDYHYRQAITAAGAGCRAAMDAEVYIEGVA